MTGSKVALIMHCMQEEPFVWTKQWYPLAVVDDLNPLKPFATKLLGAPPLLAACGPHHLSCPLASQGILEGIPLRSMSCRQGPCHMEGWRGPVALLSGHVSSQVGCWPDAVCIAWRLGNGVVSVESSDEDLRRASAPHPYSSVDCALAQSFAPCHRMTVLPVG